MNLLNKSLKFNLLLMTGVALLGFIAVGWGLDFYTLHGESVVIPSLSGKPLGEGVSLLAEVDLRCEVVDSVYDKHAVPGTIIESYPASGERVKPNRIIFVKIYASEPPKVAIPHVKDMSARQAYALLRAMGFEMISEKSVAGDYIGSCQGIALSNGRLLSTGEMISKETPLVLLVTGTIGLDSISVDDLLAVDSLVQGALVDKRDTLTNHTPSKSDPNQEPEEWW